MLSNTLNANEVKKADGTEIEFTRRNIEGSTTEFSVITELPAYPHRLSIKHREIGTGANRKRQSVVRVDKTVVGVSGSPVKCFAQTTIEIPVGDLSAFDEPKNVLAELMSFLATTGAGTTVLFDCSGNGAAALIGNSL